MFQKLSILSLLLVCFFSAFSQVDFTEAKYSGLLDGNFEEIITLRDGSVYVLSDYKKSFYIHKVDAQTLKARTSWEIDKKEIGLKKADVELAMASDEGLHVLLKNPAKGKGISFVECHLGWDGEIKEKKEVAFLEKVPEELRISYYKSEDRSKIAVVWMPREGAYPRVFVFDNRMDLQWEGALRNPFKETFEVGQMEVSNNGDLWFVGYLNSKRKKWYEVKPSASYAVARVKGEEMLVYQLENKQKIFYNLNIKPDLKPGLVVLTGFYGEDEEA